jgi:hypothetical protein
MTIIYDQFSESWIFENIKKTQLIKMIIDYSSLSKYLQIAYIWQYMAILVAAIGSLANILTFCVFMRKRFAKYAFAFYIRVMTLTDTFVLLHSFRHFAAFMFNASLETLSSFNCHLDEYSVYVFASLSFWLLALIAFDRMITIVFPTRFQLLKKRYFQILLVGVLFAYSIILYLPMAIYYRLEVDPSNNQSATCVIVDNKSDLFYWTDLINTIVVTFFLNNILAIILIVFIFRSRTKFSAKVAKNKSSNSTSVRDRNFAINSIVLNLNCFVCKVPLLICLLVATYVNMDPDAVTMMFTIGVTIYTIDNSSSFFVNIIFNSMFYDEFLIMFRLKSTRHAQFSNTLASTISKLEAANGDTSDLKWNYFYNAIPSFLIILFY